MRFVYSLPSFSGQCVLAEKILFGGQQGWILFLEPTRTGFYLHGGVLGWTAFANGAMADGDIHVTSVSYNASTGDLDIKSDLYPQSRFSVGGPLSDLSILSPMSIGDGNVADTRVGLTKLFTGLCRGANARAYYDEVVVLP